MMDLYILIIKEELYMIIKKVALKKSIMMLTILLLTMFLLTGCGEEESTKSKKKIRKI